MALSPAAPPQHRRPPHLGGGGTAAAGGSGAGAKPPGKFRMPPKSKFGGGAALSVLPQQGGSVAKQVSSAGLQPGGMAGMSEQTKLQLHLFQQETVAETAALKTALIMAKLAAIDEDIKGVVKN
eukprot:gene1474-19386_t